MAKIGRPRGRTNNRNVILGVARRLFADAGYDKTSVRDVATAAGDPDPDFSGPIAARAACRSGRNRGANVPIRRQSGSQFAIHRDRDRAIGRRHRARQFEFNSSRPVVPNPVARFDFRDLFPGNPELTAES